MELSVSAIFLVEKVACFDRGAHRFFPPEVSLILELKTLSQETDLEKNQKLRPQWKIPLTKVHDEKSLQKTKKWPVSDDLVLRSDPSFRKKTSDGKCYNISIVARALRPQFRSLRPPPKTDLERKKNCYTPNEKSHMAWRYTTGTLKTFFWQSSDDFGLRSPPAIQKPFSPKKGIP